MCFKNSTFVLLFCCLVLTFISCSKEENKIEGCTDSTAINYNSNAEIDNGLCEYVTPLPVVISVKELLATQSWYLTDLEKTDTLTQITINAYSSVPACEKDNYLTFTQSFALTNNEGAIKCLSTNPQVENGIWSWGNNESELTVDLPLTGTTNYDIISIDATTLVLTYFEGGNKCKSTLKHSL